MSKALYGNRTLLVTNMTADKPNITDLRLVLVALFSAISLAAMFLLDPIPQDLSYHAFADSRSLLGIPNSLNVLSNIPFLLVGVYGLYSLANIERSKWHPAWVVLFIGVLLVGFGSSFYHLSPNSGSLVWDRLPMTVGFMGLFVALLSEFSGLKLGSVSLASAVTIGIGSVVYWAVADDLRFYAWVQFMPLAVVVILLLTYSSRFTHSWLLGLALVFYIVAKLAEHFDSTIYSTLGQSMSGHAFKHLFAAAGCYILLLFLKGRKPQQ